MELSRHFFGLLALGYNVRPSGLVWSMKCGRYLGSYYSVSGYRVLHINGKTVPVHRLIALCYIPNPDNKPCVNHKDMNKKNNKIDNLEWCTYKENAIHAYKNGTFKSIKYKKENVINMRDDYSGGKSLKKLMSEYCISKKTLMDILTRRTYRFW